MWSSLVLIAKMNIGVVNLVLEACMPLFAHNIVLLVYSSGSSSTATTFLKTNSPVTHMFLNRRVVQADRSRLFVRSGLPLKLMQRN
jgi:hypothetical protein